MTEELLEIVLSFSTFLVGLVMMLVAWRLSRNFRGGHVEKGYYFLFIATAAFAFHSLVYFLFDIVFPQPWVELANMATHLAAALPFLIAAYLLNKIWSVKR